MKKEININEQEKQIIVLLLRGERATVRFLTGFGKPSDKEIVKEKFLDKLIEKISKLN